MKPVGRVVLWTIALLAIALPAGAEVFVRADAGWLDVRGGRTSGVGNAYQGGFGESVELGIDLSSALAFGLEYSPGYNQPKRATTKTEDLKKATYQSMGANLFIRFEPIEDIRPYLSIGGGRVGFAFDYADSGRVFRVNGRTRRLTTDKLKGWSGVLGFGFDAPLSSHFDGGCRVRYIAHRWESASEQGIFFAFPKGDAFSVEANLKLHF